MNIKKFIRKNALFLAALAVVICIVTVLIIVNRPKVEYKTGVGEIAALIADDSNLVLPHDIVSNGKENYSGLLVDIRSAEDFNFGHIEHAVNIPAHSLLFDESLTLFKQAAATKKEVILYGSDHLQSNGPWLLLRQIGFDNIKVMKGGYEAYRLVASNDTVVQKNMLIKTEVSAFDTSAFRKPVAEKSVAAEKPAVKKTVKVVPVKVEESSGGGC